MDGPVSLAARRWINSNKPTDFSPREALEAVIRDIDSGEINPDQVIIVYLRDMDSENEGVGYYQSGKGGWIKAIGMMERAKHLLLGGE